MVHSLSYNRRFQPAEIKLKQSATGPELQRYNYSYGQVNQTDGSIDTTKNNGQIGRIDGYINGTKQWDQRMIYDSLGRLSTSAEYRGDTGGQTWQAHYDHDRFGNRFQYQSNSNINYTTVQTTDIDPNRNRFLETGATPINYDAAGNITTDAKFRGMNYQYDANGRMTFAERTDHTNPQTSIYDCAGQRVRTVAGSVTRTMVFDIFGQNVADYLGSSGERENIYHGGQLLATETPFSSAPSGLATNPSSSSVALSWTAAAGATNYRVERKAAGGAFTYLAATANTNFTDNTVTNGSAYLYQVCAANAQNACASGYTNVALGAAVSFTDNPLTVGVTVVKAQHVTELRSTVNAVRSLAGLSAATWTDANLSSVVIKAVHIQEMRDKLDEALTALGISTSSFTDPTLTTGANGTLVKAIHFAELRQRVTSGAGIGGGGTTGGLQYVLSDLQGSARDDEQQRRRHEHNHRAT